jgi:thiol-disulfide isomerase/thioredoxin
MMLRTVFIVCSMLALALSKDAEAASARSQNFVVEAPTAEVANQVAHRAEQCRRDEALDWIGVELPPWDKPCVVSIEITRPNLSGGGATCFCPVPGQVGDFSGKWGGTPEQLISDVVPHEVMHTVMASALQFAAERWADEGAAVCCESDAVHRHWNATLIECLRTGRGFPTHTLLAAKEYPRDFEAFYAQSQSLVTFLVDLGGKRKFVSAIADARRSNWGDSIRSNYSLTLPALQDAWLDWVKAGSPRRQANLAANEPAEDEQAPVTIYDFRSDSCGPCRQMDPIVQELRSEGLNIQAIDVGANQTLAGKYGVSAIPCFVAVQDGKEVGRLTGATDKESLRRLACCVKIPRRPPAARGPLRPLGAAQGTPRIDGPVQAQPQAQPPMVPIPQAQEPPDLSALEKILTDAVNSRVQPIVESGLQKIGDKLDGDLAQAVSKLPVSGELKSAITNQGAQITSALGPLIEKAILEAPKAAAPFLEAAIASKLPAAPGILAQFGPAGVLAGLGLTGLGLLWRKLSKTGASSQSLHALVSLVLAQRAPATAAGAGVPFDVFGAIKDLAANVAKVAAKSQPPAASSSEPAAYQDNYFLNPAAADELADKRAKTQGMTLGQQGLLAQLQQEAMLLLSKGAFGKKIGQELAEAIEHWVLKEFLKKHGVRTALGGDSTFTAQPTIQ